MKVFFSFKLSRLIVIALIQVGVLSVASFSSAADWPQWRGPDGQGRSDATGLPTTWDATSKANIRWSVPIPGSGHSSPVIEGDRIWLTTSTHVPEGKARMEERLKSNTGGQPLIVASQVTFYAVCVDLKSGKQLHHIKLFSVHEPQWIHQLNSFSSGSPVIEDGKLYCHFGSNGTVCFDTKTLKNVWVNRELQTMHENGPGSSPVISGDHLIFHMDGSDKQYVAGLNKHTGKVAWQTKRSGKMHINPQLKKAYGTPLVVDVNGKKQVISPGANWVYSYEPDTGKELWKQAYGVLGFSLVPRPITGHGMVYVVTSFMKSELLAVRFDEKGKKPGPHIVWRYTRAVPRVGSPLLVGSEIYFVNDKGGAMTCLDARTGKVHYTERLGGNFSSSPMYADGKIYICAREGVTTVVKPGPTFKKLASNSLPGEILASPAAVDGAIVIRTKNALYCIEQKK